MIPILEAIGPIKKPGNREAENLKTTSPLSLVSWLLN